MGEPPTARDYAGIHTVHAVCRDSTRDHWQGLDLAALVAAGQGDVPLIQLPLRCSACGRARHQIKVSGRSWFGPPRAGVHSTGTAGNHHGLRLWS
jgi:hypothetical protein